MFRDPRRLSVFFQRLMAVFSFVCILSSPGCFCADVPYRAGRVWFFRTCVPPCRRRPGSRRQAKRNRPPKARRRGRRRAAQIAQCLCRSAPATAVKCKGAYGESSDEQSHTGDEASPSPPEQEGRDGSAGRRELTEGLIEKIVTMGIEAADVQGKAASLPGREEALAQLGRPFQERGDGPSHGRPEEITQGAPGGCLREPWI